MPTSILRDAGTVAAVAIAERPVAWTLVAGGSSLLVWRLSTAAAVVWPSGWVVAAVLVAAVACSAVVRDRRGLPAMLAVLAAVAALVGKGDDPSTLLTTAGAGAIAATLLLHGSPRALRIAGSVALALGCTFALWRAGWRVGQGPLAIASSVPAFRLAGFRQEVVIAAGLAMLTPVVRPRIAAALVVGAGIVISIDYFVVFGAAAAYAVVAILSCGAAGCCGAAVRVSGAAANDDVLARGRLAGRLQRGAGIAGVLAGCVLIEDVGWAAVLHRGVEAEGDVRTHWFTAVSGMEFACLAGLCARLKPRGAVFRVVAGLAVASIAVAASAWAQPLPGVGPWQAAGAAISSTWWSVPIVATAAALAVRAPAWPRSTLAAGIAVATIGGTLHAVRVGLDDPWTQDSAGPLLDYMAGALWCVLGVLAASMPIGRAGAAALVVGAAAVTEVGSRAALALAPDGDLPLAPRWAELVWASAISLCCVLVLRPFCARTPVPEHHPIHRDFDLLSRGT